MENYFFTPNIPCGLNNRKINKIMKAMAFLTILITISK